MSIYNSVQLYLYSHQDLIIVAGAETHNINAGIFHINLHPNENIVVYSTNSIGSMVINNEIISGRKHSQLEYYTLNDNAILCEIKPFINNIAPHTYSVNDNVVTISPNKEGLYIYFNHEYIGNITGDFSNIHFQKLDENKLGLIMCEKNIILFNNNLIYCGQYIDYEVNKKHIQIYSHQPNIFNIGQLIKYEFDREAVIINNVCDRGNERKQISTEYSIIYFLDAVKCGRYKYAHNRLSTELKLTIDADILQQYFKTFDDFIYLQEEDCYITLKNNKVTGIYHFVVKDGLIDNIY